ncbi:MAG TPA: alpha/beta fold hydrolase [Ktedonobacterales bacterium]|nr:alpha/beta fold hydrolase [Ktedonobacterales bacterium]
MADNPDQAAEVTRQRQRPSSRLRVLSRVRRVLIVLMACIVLAYALAPGIRGITLVANRSGRSAPNARSAGIPAEEIHFTASDGVPLAGWLSLVSADAPTIILVHGFKGTRATMLPWARFLHAAGYNVLLYDSRGCGESTGWGIGLGATEPNDVIGAAHYLASRSDLTNKRFGALGISLGAGIVLLAAARDPAIAAVVADSAWTDESAQLDRMGTLPLGPLAVPALPYEPALVDALIGAHLADARPLAVVAQVAPRAVFFIHSADDRNATTPLSGERQLFAAAGQPKQEWIAPSGGHTGALAAHPADYQQRVLAFFAQYLDRA